jgi:predicted alpha/beta-fold hydrolase
MPSELARFINHVHDSMEILDDDDDVLATNFSQPSESISNDMTSLTAKSTESPDAHAFREQAFLLSSSFEPRDFCPPRQLANEHFQTISGVFLRNDPECRYVSGGVSISSAVEKGAKLLSSLSKEADVYGDFWDHRQRISTPDGDFFHVDYKFQSDSFDMPFSKGLVVIVHGLQSNSNSSLSVDLGRAFANEGFDVACINFRGCSGVPNNSLRAYHLGFTDDLIQFLAMSNNGKLKPPPIFLSGFSLGANVVLKALGQLGSRAFDEFNVYGAAVSGAPFDNERNIQFVQQAGFNKLAYNDSLLKSLKNTALQQLNRFADSKEAKTISLEEISTLKEISAIESALIAPVFGFRDNVDYYRKTNCINFLDDIQVPTLVLNAADDPFFDPSFFPFEKGCDSAFGKEKRTPVKLVRTEHGGHLGFMFHQRRREEMNMKLGQSETSFMPQELARFVSHVFEGRNSLQKSAG